jgi:hypothetical protein
MLIKTIQYASTEKRLVKEEPQQPKRHPTGECCVDWRGEEEEEVSKRVVDCWTT